MFNFFIFDKNLKPLEDTISNLDYRYKNHQGYFRHIGNYIRELISKSFQNDGLPIRWVELSPSYLASQQKIHSKYPIGILKLTGSMMESFTKLGSMHNIQKISQNMAQYGSKNPIAIYHYTGTKYMPKRDPIQVPDTFVDELTEKLAKFITGKLNE